MNRKFFAVAALALAASSTFAQPSMTAGKTYVGIAGGVSHINDSCADGFNCDNDKGAIKVYGGYTFANDLSAELTYYSLGTFKESANVGGTDVGASLQGSYWGLGGAWRPTFGGGWGGVGRVGAAYSHGKISGTGIDSESRDSWQPYAGLGVTYDITKDIKLEADYDFTRVGSQFTDPNTGIRSRGTDNVSAFMLGASMSF